MSNAYDARLRDTLERHRTTLHDREVAAADVAAKDDDFMRQYVAHRDHVIAPTLLKLRSVVGEFGHDLVIDGGARNEAQPADDRSAIQATLLLHGYDQTYKSACPQIRFSPNRAARTIDVHARDQVPHQDGVSAQQEARTIQDLPPEKIEELFLGIVQRALAVRVA